MGKAVAQGREGPAGGMMVRAAAVSAFRQACQTVATGIPHGQTHLCKPLVLETAVAAA